MRSASHGAGPNRADFPASCSTGPSARTSAPSPGPGCASAGPRPRPARPSAQRRRDTPASPGSLAAPPTGPPRPACAGCPGPWPPAPRTGGRTGAGTRPPSPSGPRATAGADEFPLARPRRPGRDHVARLYPAGGPGMSAVAISSAARARAICAAVPANPAASRPSGRQHGERLSGSLPGMEGCSAGNFGRILGPADAAVIGDGRAILPAMLAQRAQPVDAQRVPPRRHPGQAVHARPPRQPQENRLGLVVAGGQRHRADAQTACPAGDQICRARRAWSGRLPVPSQPSQRQIVWLTPSRAQSAATERASPAASGRRP